VKRLPINASFQAPRWLWTVWGLALLLTIGLALNISPWLLGDADWRWRHVPLIDFTNLAYVALLLAIYIGLAAILWRWALQGTHPQRGWWIVAYVSMASLVIQVATQTISSPDPFSSLMLRTTSPFLSGYHDAALEVEDVSDFLRRFPEIAPNYLPHPQRHPPGLILYFVSLERWFEQFPALATQITKILRRYRCEQWPLLYASDAQYAAAAGGLLTLWLNALAAIPLYAAGRSLIGRSAALAAVLITPLIPGYILWAGIWDQAFVIVTTLTLWLLDQALRLHRSWAWWAAGVLLSLASFFTYAMLVLVGFVVIYTLLRLYLPREFQRASLPQGLWNSLGFLIGLTSVWLAYWLAFGVTFIEVYAATTAAHFAMSTRYVLRLIYNPYDFVLFLGYGLGLLWLAAVWQTVTDRTSLDERLTSPRRSLVLAFTLTMSLLTLSGVSRAEVGRVWVFLMPLAVLAAFTVEHGPAHSIRHWIMTAALLGVQLLVMQSVLVLDDAIMPSPRERLRLHQTSLPPTAKPMRSHLGQTIDLAGFEVNKVRLQPGTTLRLTLYWQAFETPARVYTRFVHVYENKAGLSAQHDSPPREGQYPTTCWQPGEIVADTVSLTLPPQAAPGIYQVIVGMYDPAADNQRLPTSGPGAHDSAIVVTQVEVSASASP